MGFTIWLCQQLAIEAMVIGKTREFSHERNGGSFSLVM